MNNKHVVLWFEFMEVRWCLAAGYEGGVRVMNSDICVLYTE